MCTNIKDFFKTFVTILLKKQFIKQKNRCPQGHLKISKYVRVYADHDVYDHIVRVIGVVESYIVAVGNR